MGYYNKKDVVSYIETENKKAQERSLSPLTPIEQTLSSLDNEEDVVGFFWVNITEGEKMNLEGKTFVRVDYNLYTDDRFAIDLYQAQSDGITVSDVIKQRTKEQEEASKSIVDRKAVEEEIIKKAKQRADES